MHGNEKTAAFMGAVLRISYYFYKIFDKNSCNLGSFG